MEKSDNKRAANKWLNVLIIATITRILCRELTLQNEYLRQENKIPSEYNKNDERQGGSVPIIKHENVIRKDFLGGLLKSYRSAA